MRLGGRGKEKGGVQVEEGKGGIPGEGVLGQSPRDKNVS